MVFDEKKNHRIPEIFAVFRCIQCYSSVKTNIHRRNMLFIGITSKILVKFGFELHRMPQIFLIEFIEYHLINI